LKSTKSAAPSSKAARTTSMTSAIDAARSRSPTGRAPSRQKLHGAPCVLNPHMPLGLTSRCIPCTVPICHIGRPLAVRRP
jgi:hypothetical protein